LAFTYDDSLIDCLLGNWQDRRSLKARQEMAVEVFFEYAQDELAFPNFSCEVQPL
jgi:hypothetical protein